MSEPSEFASRQLEERCDRLSRMLKIRRGVDAGTDDPEVAALADDDSLADGADAGPRVAVPVDPAMPIEIVDREVGLVQGAIDRYLAERKAGSN